MNDLAVFAAIIAGFLAAFLLFRFFFRDGKDFGECVAYTLMPDFISLFRGQLFKDWAASLRLTFYIFTCFLAGLGTYHGMIALFGPSTP